MRPAPLPPPWLREKRSRGCPWVSPASAWQTAGVCSTSHRRRRRARPSGAQPTHEPWPLCCVNIRRARGLAATRKVHCPAWQVRGSSPSPFGEKERPCEQRRHPLQPGCRPTAVLSTPCCARLWYSAHASPPGLVLPRGAASFQSPLRVRRQGSSTGAALAAPRHSRRRTGLVACVCALKPRGTQVRVRYPAAIPHPSAVTHSLRSTAAVSQS